MLKTKYVGNNFEMLVTILVVFVTNNLSLDISSANLAQGTIGTVPTSKRCLQYLNYVTNIYVAVR